MNEIVKNLMLWLFIALVLISVFSSFGARTQASRISYSQFKERVAANQIKQVVVENDREIVAMTKNNTLLSTYIPMSDPFLLDDLMKHNVDVQGKRLEKQGILSQILLAWGPAILILVVWVYFIMKQSQGLGGGRGALSFGRSRARMLNEDQIKVTFADVAGCDEAKEEVQELVDFLKDPSKFQAVGGKIPKGVLMVGRPGTGKTLLARAIAGEAKVPFFTISGSDFVEMFVGVGASRVRDMFEQAKKMAPCIIFIDEIDAVGRHRGAGLGGGHDEREQTLNQLLVEMDGFEGHEGVIVIAATNRPDVLDPALLRPGRFDRQVVVGLPDVKGREQILKVHLRKVPIDDTVKPMLIARGTPGFSGADLANLVNEAALFAARCNKKVVDMQDLEKAKDKIIMGVERKSMVMSEKDRRVTAYHEAGHALVGLNIPVHDPIYKVTIIPRGRALGVAMFLPEGDMHSVSRQQLEAKIATAFGGRVAEELIFGRECVTTGASSDIDVATKIAKGMVTKYGLSDKLGPIAYGEDEGEVFLGHSMGKRQEISDETARIIDEETKEIIDRMYKKATDILIQDMDKLHIMAEALLKYETIDMEQISAIMEGREPKPPKGWDDASNNSDDQQQNKAKKSSKNVKNEGDEAQHSNVDPVGEV